MSTGFWVVESPGRIAGVTKPYTRRAYSIQATNTTPFLTRNKYLVVVHNDNPPSFSRVCWFQDRSLPYSACGKTKVAHAPITELKFRNFDNVRTPISSSEQIQTLPPPRSLLSEPAQLHNPRCPVIPLD